MTESERPLIRVRKNPCPSCPFRKDCPSGIWDESEYEHLRIYDGDIGQQIVRGATSTFHCHSTPEDLCAGWVGTFGPWELAVLRLHSDKLDPSVWDYETSVALHESGQAAYEHGMARYKAPGDDARQAILKIKRLRPEVGFGDPPIPDEV